MNKITFSPSDFPNPGLEPVADQIASFLFKYKSKFGDFCELMRFSGNWSISNYKSQLQKWESSIIGRRGRKNAAPDTLQLIDLCHTFFSICSSDDELRKMRGLVPEKLIEKVFSLRYNGRPHNIGYGVIVNVNGQPVRYQCSNPYDHGAEDSDRNRQTVDAGAWDGNIGEFAEIKFRPEAFHTKDIKYLRTLAQRLVSDKIDYKIFLICFDDKNLTAEQLKKLHLWTESEFILIGRNEVFDLQQSSYAA
ncbi:hypothetical protein V7654_15155 [Bacillus sp. JJ1609]|uniref:hypothetical protein n=1 Tax=Bacillus sp. JJ1609 TaxID=3122977 RepID=UPI002FFEC8C8